MRKLVELFPIWPSWASRKSTPRPLFQASAASSHGYDVNDYNSVSISLGGREGLDCLSAELRQHDIGLLLDFVPNHMGIDGEYNYWWRHVLENGAQSKYAPFFDIEWHPRLERLNDRILVPMLDKHYGVVLESGRFKLRYEKGRFLIQYESLKLPIRPQTYRVVFSRIDEKLSSGDVRKSRLRELSDAFDNLDRHDLQLRDHQFDELRAQWAAMLSTDPLLQDLLRDALTEINGIPGNPNSFIALHDLLEDQHYRLAHWKVGAHEVNYRRFFAVDTLVGLKMESAEVFAATHQLLAELIASKTITGIRLDHIDGLWNPVEYLARLEQLVQTKQPNAPLWTLVEKILAPQESLVKSWPVHGTSGYEFAASLIELFLDRRDQGAWTRIYESFTGETKTSRDLTYEDKLFALEEIFPNAVNNLAVELDSLIEPDWHRRDFSLHDLKTALRHLLACLPVYRTYRMPGERMCPEEARWVVQAVEEGIAVIHVSTPNPCALSAQSLPESIRLRTTPSATKVSSGGFASSSKPRAPSWPSPWKTLIFFATCACWEPTKLAVILHALVNRLLHSTRQINSVSSKLPFACSPRPRMTPR